MNASLTDRKNIHECFRQLIGNGPFSGEYDGTTHELAGLTAMLRSVTQAHHHRRFIKTGDKMIRYRRFIFYNQHLQPSFELDKLRFEATRIVSSSPCSKLVVDTKLLHLQLFKHLLTLSTTANTSDLFDPILTF